MFKRLKQWCCKTRPIQCKCGSFPSIYYDGPTQTRVSCNNNCVKDHKGIDEEDAVLNWNKTLHKLHRIRKYINLTDSEAALIISKAK